VRRHTVKPGKPTTRDHAAATLRVVHRCPYCHQHFNTPSYCMDGRVRTGLELSQPRDDLQQGAPAWQHYAPDITPPS
jgi:hypothetical protein